jgi:hypothetical protein
MTEDGAEESPHDSLEESGGSHQASIPRNDCAKEHSAGMRQPLQVGY